MADVFICHTSTDRQVADQIVAALEARGVTCWIAPRDVDPGTEYATAIMEGIAASRLLLLALSGASNESQHVRREVERAVARDLPVLPVRLHDVAPSPGLEYYISDAQWFDAFEGGIERHLPDLVETVRRGLGLAGTVPVGGGTARRELGPVAVALGRVIDRYGPDLASDPRRLGALLRDLAGEHRAEIAALVVAAEEGVPQAISGMSAAATDSTVGRLAEDLRAQRALAVPAAERAVRTWAAALGVEIVEDGPEALLPPPPDTGAAVTAAGAGEPAAPGPAALAAPSAPRRNRPAGRFIAAAVVTAAVIGGGVGLGVLSGDGEGGGVGSSVPGASEIFLEPRNDPGPDAFTSTVAESVPDLPQSTAFAPEAVADEFGGIPAVLGSEVGLYGGTLDNSQCDAEQMIAFLEENEDKARAWAEVQSITTTALRAYIRDLTPVLLNQDTRVTNHGFSDGRATARQSVLERGTAVLVDRRGVPRARCACGNPLLAPTPIESPTYVGEAWDGFDATDVAVIRPGDPVNEITLVDVFTGEQFDRPFGSGGEEDTPVTTTTSEPSTTSTTATTSTTTTTTAPPQPQPITSEGSVTASSSFSGEFPAALSVDGDVTTSWFSAGSNADGDFSEYRWEVAQDELILRLDIVSNADHEVPDFRTGFGFQAVIVQVLDESGAPVFEERVELPGTPDPTVTVHPNARGRSVVLRFEGHEDPTCGGFAELVVTAGR